MRTRLVVLITGAVLLLAASTGTAVAAGVPHWLIVRVHALVASDQQQAAEIATLQAQVKADGQAISTLQSQVATLQSQSAGFSQEFACQRVLGVSLARVRSETGRTRMVLRLPVPGAAPVYRVLRLRAAC